MQELEVHPCANGKQCYAVYDKTEQAIIILSRSQDAMGYINLSDILEKAQIKSLQ